jgi:hypothetical protein
MSIPAPETFRARIETYAEQNPEASVPEILGRFLAEPTDEQREFVESALSTDTGEDEAPQTADEADGVGGVA